MNLSCKVLIVAIIAVATSCESDVNNSCIKYKIIEHARFEDCDFAITKNNRIYKIGKHGLLDMRGDVSEREIREVININGHCNILVSPRSFSYIMPELLKISNKITFFFATEKTSFISNNYEIQDPRFKRKPFWDQEAE